MVSESLERSKSTKPYFGTVGALICLIVLGSGCASKAPTIAHVHIGHAITGHASTPHKEGFFQLAEEQAAAAAGVVDSFNTSSPSRTTLSRQMDELSTAMSLEDEFAFGSSLQEAANHMTYAANSDDASPNVRMGAKMFESSIQPLLVRTELIKLYIDESKQSSSDEEAGQYAAEIQKMVRTNLSGEDLNGNGQIGDEPDEYGVRQLRRDIDNMIASEYPPYRTVDRWYLFNLIRMPSGEWLFRRSKSGSGPGYQ